MSEVESGDLKCTEAALMPEGDPYSATASISISDVAKIRRQVERARRPERFMREVKRIAPAATTLNSSGSLLACAQERATKFRASSEDLIELPEDHLWSYATGRLPSPVTWIELELAPEDFFAQPAKEVGQSGVAGATGGMISALCVEGLEHLDEYMRVEFTNNRMLESMRDTVNAAFFFVSFRYASKSAWHREILRIGVAWYFDEDDDQLVFWPVSLGGRAPEETPASWQTRTLTRISETCFTFVLHFLEIVNARSVETVSRTAKPKLRTGSGKKRRVDVEYKELDVYVDGGTRYKYVDPETGETRTRRSPRKHFRRGHWRMLPSGERTWVRSCIVNPEARGVVHKTYNVTKKPERTEESGEESADLDNKGA